MATITATTLRGTKGAVTATVTTLTASDVLPYVSGGQQVLQLFNTTALPVVVTIDGAGSTTISPEGYGGTLDVSAGKAITVGANATVFVNLDSISAFLAGAVAVTGGVGVTATLLS